MQLAPPLSEAIERTTRAQILATLPVAGGDICGSYRLELSDRRTVFIKTRRRAPRGFFEAEVQGLLWLRQANALRIPEVIGTGVDNDGAYAFLMLEDLGDARPSSNFDEALGQGLAEIHHLGAPHFGFETNNFIGTFEQTNEPEKDWATFYVEKRLRPQLDLAKRTQRADSRLLKAFDRLFRQMPDLVGPIEPPARLHGDLWRGNIHCDARGNPSLIDPSVYGGHREIDLAMMQLFGGFGPRVFDAYRAVHPLSPDASRRTALHQLYPLLVHLNLFGPSYTPELTRALAGYV